MRRAVFADLKTDFVFKRVFGVEEHKDLLIALLNALLALSGDRAIAEVTFLREEERPRVEELKFSVVDVKCRDGRGTIFMVEMQMLNVAGFEKRVVYNASKAYVGRLAGGDDYPKLNDVITVSVCGFHLWPGPSRTHAERSSLRKSEGRPRARPRGCALRSKQRVTCWTSRSMTPAVRRWLR